MVRRFSRKEIKRLPEPWEHVSPTWARNKKTGKPIKIDTLVKQLEEQEELEFQSRQAHRRKLASQQATTPQPSPAQLPLPDFTQSAFLQPQMAGMSQPVYPQGQPAGMPQPAPPPFPSTHQHPPYMPTQAISAPTYPMPTFTGYTQNPQAMPAYPQWHQRAPLQQQQGSVFAFPPVAQPIQAQFQPQVPPAPPMVPPVVNVQTPEALLATPPVPDFVYDSSGQLVPTPFEEIFGED